MARGTALSDLLTMLHNELAYNTNSTTDDVILTGLLNNKQLWYSSAFDWPFLRTRVDVAVTAGQRFYPLPALDYERPHSVQLYWNTIFRPLVYGIKESDYNVLNPYLNPPTMVDPVQKWLIISDQEGGTTGAANNFEVWPVPASGNGAGGNPYFARFIGQQVIPELVDPTDLALLDDLLLVKSVAGDFLARSSSPDAQLKLSEAAKRFTQLQSAYPQRDSTFRVGQGKDRFPHRYQPGDNIVLLAPN